MKAGRALTGVIRLPGLGRQPVGPILFTPIYNGELLKGVPLSA